MPNEATDRPDDMTDATWLVSSGRPELPGEPLNVPPILATNFNYPTAAGYSRSSGTATIAALEQAIGGLEGGMATVFASGMAAASAVLDLVPVGGHLIIPDDAYHGVTLLAANGQVGNRWTTDQISVTDTAAWNAAAGEAAVMWIESPTNPLMEIADLPAVAAATAQTDTWLAVDSTFATSLGQRPLDMGADIVMHSATKFFGGHSDLLCGVLVTRDPTLHEAFRTARTLNGAVPGAMETWLCLRGLRTLHLRVHAAQRNAGVLAERLAAHPAVERVRYPGLSSDPGHKIASSFMSGFGALLSFEVAGGGDAAAAVCETARIIHHATSLGGVESTMERRGAIAGQESIPPGLIRFSVGCEDVDDLWSDLDAALGSA